MGLLDLLTGDSFLLAAELSPPKGTDLGPLLDLAARLKGRLGALEIADHPEGVMRASALATATRVAAAGLPAVLRLNCRDRNRLALQGELLGAQLADLAGVLLETGRDPAFGDHPNARAAADLELTGLAEAAAALRAGKDLAGLDLEGGLTVPVGAEIDFWAAEGAELAAAKNQAAILAEHGVAFFRTSAVYDPAAFQQRLPEFAHLGVPLVAGVGLLKSGGMARYINRNVPGCKVPKDVIKQLQKAPDKREASVEIAAQTVQGLRGAAAGVCLLPLGWDDLLPAVVTALGEG